MQIYSIQTEKRVLGGLINYQSIFPDLDVFLTDQHFFNDVHSTIYMVIKACLQEGQKVDKVVLANKIKNLGISFKDDIDIFEYIDDLTFTEITEQGTIDNAHDLHEIRLRRDLKEVLRKGIRNLETPNERTFDDIVSELDDNLNSEISKYGFNNDAEDLFDDLEQFAERLGDEPVEETGFKTPFPEFNRLYGGLRPGNLYAFAARPGQGKTTLLSYLGLHTYLSNPSKPRVLMLDTEMSKKEMQMRLLASLSGVDAWYLETGNWRKNAEMIQKVRDVWPKIKGYTMDHFRVGEKTVEQVISFIRRWYYKNVKRGKPAIIIYDYLKLTGEGLGKNWAEYQAIGEKVSKLKKIGEELNSVILTAVQLNRSGENFNRTASSFFDDSSAIAQSDRLQWFATFVAICRRKTPDEIALDGVQFGTHKFIPLKARFQGRDASGHHDLLLRNIEGTQRWVNNYLNFSMDNFVVREHGSLADIIEHESAQHELDDGVNDNSNLGLH
jgi:replicative DNA helicase